MSLTLHLSNCTQGSEACVDEKIGTEAELGVHPGSLNRWYFHLLFGSIFGMDILAKASVLISSLYLRMANKFCAPFIFHERPFPFQWQENPD